MGTASDDPILTAADVAEYAKVDEATVNYWFRRRGLRYLPARTKGGRQRLELRTRRSWVDEFFDRESRRAEEPAAPPPAAARPPTPQGPGRRAGKFDFKGIARGEG